MGEQREVEEIKGRGGEIKHGRKEPKENEADAEIDTVSAKEEAKAKAPRGFFDGVRPDSSTCTTIGRHENVKEDEAESKLERERRLIEKEGEELRARERDVADRWMLNEEPPAGSA